MLVCHCWDIRSKELQELALKCSTLEEYHAMTEAGNGCGGCSDIVDDIYYKVKGTNYVGTKRNDDDGSEH